MRGKVLTNELSLELTKLHDAIRCIELSMDDAAGYLVLARQAILLAAYAHQAEVEGKAKK